MKSMLNCDCIISSKALGMEPATISTYIVAAFLTPVVLLGFLVADWPPWATLIRFLVVASAPAVAVVDAPLAARPVRFD